MASSTAHALLPATEVISVTVHGAMGEVARVVLFGVTLVQVALVLASVCTLPVFALDLLMVRWGSQDPVQAAVASFRGVNGDFPSAVRMHTEGGNNGGGTALRISIREVMGSPAEREQFLSFALAREVMAAEEGTSPSASAGIRFSHVARIVERLLVEGAKPSRRYRCYDLLRVLSTLVPPHVSLMAARIVDNAWTRRGAAATETAGTETETGAATPAHGAELFAEALARAMMLPGGASSREGATLLFHLCMYVLARSHLHTYVLALSMPPSAAAGPPLRTTPRPRRSFPPSL